MGLIYGVGTENAQKALFGAFEMSQCWLLQLFKSIRHMLPAGNIAQMFAYFLISGSRSAPLLCPG